MKSISKLLFKIKLDWYNESDAYSIEKNAVTNDNGSLLKRRKEMRGW